MIFFVGIVFFCNFAPTFKAIHNKDYSVVKTIKGANAERFSSPFFRSISEKFVSLHC